MIVGSSQKITLGTRCVGLSDEHGRIHPDQPYVIIRIATKEEFFEQLRTLRAAPVSPDMLDWIAAGQAYFYEISLD